MKVIANILPFFDVKTLVATLFLKTNKTHWVELENIPKREKEVEKTEWMLQGACYECKQAS